MQEFYINKNATMPMLKMELINDGRYDFNAFYEMIQNSTILFTMTNKETGVVKVSNAEAFVYPKDSCDEKYYIYYPWTTRDTKLKGVYTGKFSITFGYISGTTTPLYGGGPLIVPIQDELTIYIQ
jgi:hypothetical protein